MDVTSRRIEKALATHNGVHAKGLINYGHSVVELWYVLVGLCRVGLMASRALIMPHLLEYGHQVWHP